VSLQKKTPFDLKIRLKSKKGVFKWFHVTGSPILDGNGSIINFYGICTVREYQNPIFNKLTRISTNQKEWQKKWKNST
jgi:hypothetical protein